jgi:hypothetical protein
LGFSQKERETAMPPTHEIHAIKLLRRLISMPPEQRPNEPYDPGWCCNEHARIASLAFCCLGIRAERALGAATFARRDTQPREISPVSPHQFVVFGSQLKRDGIFDSSVTFGIIEGIPKGFQKMYGKAVSVWVLIPAPGLKEADDALQKIDEDFMAVYTPTHYKLPDVSDLERSSSTPFGKWLESVIGQRKDIWGKAAWIVAGTLATGTPEKTPENFLQLGQADLWRWIDSTPKKDDLVLRRLAELAAKS